MQITRNQKRRQAIMVGEVQRLCEDFTEQSGVAITPWATALIADILQAVVDDPHPSWEIGGRNQREEVAMGYLPKVPEILEFVRQRHPDQEKITTFDLLVDFNAICNLFCFQ